MPYSLKEHIAECYRRAEEFGRLHNRASNSEERETLRTTKQHFFLLAKVLERKLSKLQAASGRSVRKLRSGFVEEMEFAMQQHVIKANIDHIKKLLESETDQPTRAMLIRFLADEEAKQHEYLVRHARPLSGIVQ